MMPKYRVFVTAEIDDDIIVEAEDEFSAYAIAEEIFAEEYSCVYSGVNVGFQSVSAYEAEEI